MEKIYYIIGNNVDKRFLEEVKDYIAHDRRIKRLIFRSRVMALKSLLLLLLALFLFVVGNLIGYTKPVFNVMGVLSSICALVSIIGDIDDIRQKFLIFGKHFLYVLIHPLRPRHPLDLWRFYQGSVADTQMILTAQNLLDEPVGVIYTGTPYYDIHFLDTMYIRWNASFFEQVKIMFNVFCFDMKYSMDCVLAHAENELFKDGCNRISYSNSVFGILYSSAYLFKELTRRNRGKACRINIDLSGADIKESDFEAKEALITEWIYYCIPPEYIEEIGINIEKPDFTVTDLLSDDEVKGQNKAKKRKHHRKKNEVALPIKRLMALENNDKDDLPFPDAITRDSVKLITIGGAEQNLALQCIVNRYKRKNYKKNQLDLGFAENAFESSGENGFLMGTEGLVYGVSDNLFRRAQKEQSASCQAVLLYMNFGQLDVVSVYGFSALATKISLCALNYALKNSEGKKQYQDDKSLAQAIPGDHVGHRNILFYEIKDKINISEREPYVDYEMKLFSTKVGQAWDSKDLMNDINELEKQIKEYLYLGDSKNV